jgi:hypothetical protein
MESGNAHVMTSLPRIVLSLLMLLTAGLPVASPARDNERHGDRARSMPPAEVQRVAPAQLAPGAAPGVDPRSARHDAREEARAARLSPEERRQLRRDINDAGRELYRRQRQQHQD